jgi:flavin reductase (DIM6/NTAB) family NADH-FMN oxidoreductase RutF
MNLESIPVWDFLAETGDLLIDRSMVLTAGDFSAGRFNAMTIGWGSFGVMWGLPFVQVVVRPVRYTFEFMERYEHFTLCAFPQAYQSAVQLLGAKSGRDGDKIAAAGLTPEASALVSAPGYAQAELTVECRKIYGDDFKPQNFLDPRIAKQYPHRDYHRMYFGEILAVFGRRSTKVKPE